MLRNKSMKRCSRNICMVGESPEEISRNDQRTRKHDCFFGETLKKSIVFSLDNPQEYKI